MIRHYQKRRKNQRKAKAVQRRNLANSPQNLQYLANRNVLKRQPSRPCLCSALISVKRGRYLSSSERPGFSRRWKTKKKMTTSRLVNQVKIIRRQFLKIMRWIRMMNLKLSIWGR